MRKIILLLFVALSFSACKKENLQNCIIGEWHRTDGSILNITNSKYTYNTGVSLGYTLNGNIISFSNGGCKRAYCNNKTLTIELYSCNGLPGAVDGTEGTYTKN